MAHCTNLVVQTLSTLLLVVWIENLLQCLSSCFTHSFKKHLDFTKILKFMAIKGNKIFWNVKTRWISMLSPTKIIMAKYKTLLMKMALDIPTNQQVMLNYEHLCNIHILLGLICILLLLKSMHVLIKFEQPRNMFVHDLVVAIKVCQNDVYNMYYDEIFRFIVDSF